LSRTILISIELSSPIDCLLKSSNNYTISLNYQINLLLWQHNKIYANGKYFAANFVKNIETEGEAINAHQ
jgi:hypothetical protein